MRIGFDYRPGQRQNSRYRGVGRQTQELAQAMLRLNRGRHDFVCYAVEAPRFGGEGSCQVQTTVQLKRPGRLNWLLDEALLSHRLRRDRIDLFQSTEITSIPRPGGWKVWAFVYDLIPYVFWEETCRRVPWDYRVALQRAKRRILAADRVITFSEFTRSDLGRLWGFPAEKIEVIPLGCASGVRQLEKEAARHRLQQRFGLAPPFLLYVGGSDFRKNLALLLRAFERLREGGYPGKLALIGETFTGSAAEVKRLLRLAGELRIRGDLWMPGYVSDEDLSALYSACDFFVFPSLYEGFGLPLLEALRCGAPVLSSDRSALPEVGGDAVTYFSPDEPASLVAAYRKAQSNPGGTERRRERGLERAREFTWQRAAEALLDLYQEASGP